MNENVYWFIEGAVKEGEIDNLKALIKEMVEATEGNEPGTKMYEWFFSADEKTVYLFEFYQDSQATMVHLDSFGKNFAGRFMAAIDMKRFVIMGNPDDKVRSALQSVGAKLTQFAGGFKR